MSGKGLDLRRSYVTQQRTRTGHGCGRTGGRTNNGNSEGQRNACAINTSDANTGEYY
jgi:hypothetical protein